MSLNGSNWRTWKGKMLDLLYCKEMHAPLEGNDAKPKDTIDEKWKCWLHSIIV